MVSKLGTLSLAPTPVHLIAEKKIKKWLKPVLFTAGGALVGLAYYYFVGCPTGACPLTSNPFITMAYMGFIGWLLSGIFGKGCSGSCNTQ